MQHKVGPKPHQPDQLLADRKRVSSSRLQSLAVLQVPHLSKYTHQEVDVIGLFA